eukprot:365661-Chlamydomonas_euryale.AAC.75
MERGVHGQMQYGSHDSVLRLHARPAGSLVRGRWAQSICGDWVGGGVNAEGGRERMVPPGDGGEGDVLPA